MLTTLSRSFRTAFIDAHRNLRLSFFTTLFLLVALLFVDVFFFTRILADTTVKSLEDRLDITLYFKRDTKEEDVIALREDLQKQQGVASVLYVSREEVLQQFRDRHKNDAPILSSLELLDDNPLGARLVIDVASPTFFPSLKQHITESPYVSLLLDSEFADNEALIAHVGNLTRRVQQAVTAAALFFVLLALIAVYSAMTIIAAGHAEDIRVMRIVGATTHFIRLPFVLAHIGYVLVAFVVNAGIVGGGLWFLRASFASFFFGLPIQPMAVVYAELPLYVLWKFVGAVVLVAIVATVAVRRYVRVA